MAVIPPEHELSINTMAGVGLVCLQWSLLETHTLFVIYALEGIPSKKGDIIYGSLDWRPRLNMAISLARYHNAPPPIQKRLRAIRDTIRNDNLDDRRNQVVHGAQKLSADSVTFYMPRWPEEKKSQELTPKDIAALGQEILNLTNEMDAVHLAIGHWKFPTIASKTAVTRSP